MGALDSSENISLSRAVKLHRRDRARSSGSAREDGIAGVARVGFMAGLSAIGPKFDPFEVLCGKTPE